MKFFRSLLAALLCFATVQAAATPVPMVVRGHPVKQDLFSLFASPGEEIRLGLPAQDASGLQLFMEGQPYGELRDGQWVFSAPRTPGLHLLTLRHTQKKAETVLNLFVGQSAAAGDELNGYRLGSPPPPHQKYPSFYQQPQLFVEVTADNADTALSPHFTLRQFLCKQDADFPKYVVLRESLLVLLEGLLQAVRDSGYPVTTFGVISGYRTPYYNKRIGNVPNSRHVYGDAMDLFVDENGDGIMDDLNGDGVQDQADVDLLYTIVQEFKQRPENRLLIGGVGRYYKTARHGGFIHVDTRGFRARW